MITKNELDVRNQALEEAAAICDDRHHDWRWDDAPDSDSGPRDCAKRIRALASTPSAAMQGQGVPTRLAFVATDLDGRADVGLTPEKAMERAGAGCDTIIPLYDLGDAAQPQAGGRELTAEDIEGIIESMGWSLDPQEDADVKQFARAVAAHITGTKGATE